MADSPAFRPDEDRPNHEVPEVLKGSQAEVLRRLNQGDPLEIWPRVVEQLQAQCYMIEGSRLHLRSLARIAYTACHYKGEEPLHEFICRQIDRAMRELMDEDEDEEARGTPAEEPWDKRYAFVVENTGLSSGLARKACIRFNHLKHEIRSTFFAIAMEGKSVNRWVAEGHGPPAKVERMMRKAMKALSPKPGPPDAFPPEGGM